MRKVYFLRHGEAVEADEWRGDDATRPLTETGRKKMKREAKTLAKIDLKIDVLLTSPLVRAKETAEFICDAFDIDLKKDARLGNGFNRESLQAILMENPNAESIMLVGHEPTFSALAGELIGGARVDLKKGGLACVAFEGTSTSGATLAWLATPKLLGA